MAKRQQVFILATTANDGGHAPRHDVTVLSTRRPDPPDQKITISNKHEFPLSLKSCTVHKDKPTTVQAPSSHSRDISWWPWDSFVNYLLWYPARSARIEWGPSFIEATALPACLEWCPVRRGELDLGDCQMEASNSDWSQPHFNIKGKFINIVAANNEVATSIQLARVSRSRLQSFASTV